MSTRRSDAEDEPRAPVYLSPLWERVAPKAPGEGSLPKPPHHRLVQPRLRKNARAMRRIPTDAELKLWFLLRDRRLDAIKFRRQVPFKNYILDFVCFERKFVVEVDGGQHSESSTDFKRDALLSAEGFQVARYWNQRRAA